MTESRVLKERWLLAVAALAAVFSMASFVYLGSVPQAGSPPASHPPVSRGDPKRLAEIRAEFDRGVLLLRERRFDSAATAFHRVLVLDPTLPEGHLNMAFTLYEMGDLSGSRKFFESARALDPRMTGADYGIALVTFAEGDRAKAVALMRRYLTRLPESDPNRAKASRRLAEMENSPDGPGTRR